MITGISIDSFIYEFRNIDKSMNFICINGACYGFAKFVQLMYPASELYISEDKQHIIVKYKDQFYDVNGIRLGDGFVPMTQDEEVECSKWSFNKNYYAGKECPNCGEIIS